MSDHPVKTMRGQTIAGSMNPGDIAALISAVSAPVGDVGSQMPMLPGGSGDTEMVVVEQPLSIQPNTVGTPTSLGPQIPDGQPDGQRPVVVNFKGDNVHFITGFDDQGRLVMTSHNKVDDGPALQTKIANFCAGESAAMMVGVGAPGQQGIGVGAPATTMPLVERPYDVDFDVLREIAFLSNNCPLDDHAYKSVAGIPYWNAIGHRCTNGMRQVEFGTQGADQPNAQGDWSCGNVRTWKQVCGAPDDPDPRKNRDGTDNIHYNKCMDYGHPDAEAARMGLMPWLWLMIPEAEGALPTSGLHDCSDLDLNARYHKRQKIDQAKQTLFYSETRGSVLQNAQYNPHFTNAALPDGLPTYFKCDMGETVNLNGVCKAAMIKYFGKYIAPAKLISMHATQKSWSIDSGIDCKKLVIHLHQFCCAVFGGEWQAVVGPYFHLSGCGADVYVAAVEGMLMCIWRTTGGSQIKVFNKGSASLVVR